jgi:sulfur-carrier protein adenylyltransferase/sulfurtransferase
MDSKELERYSRHLALPGFGIKEQEKLRLSKVLVIGAGGLGSPVLLYLAAAGVGHLTIMDHDVVDVSNLQRQILFSDDEVGQLKVDVAKKKIRKLNPDCCVETVSTLFKEDNAAELLMNTDLVIDGSDNFSTRYFVNDTCVRANKPWVFGSIYQYQGQISVFNYKNGPTYRCLFPEAPEDIPNCNDSGVIGSLAGMIGTMMATEAIKILTGIGTPLSGKLFTCDVRENTFNTFLFERGEISLPDRSLTISCESQITDITASEFSALINNGVACIDVREASENRGEVLSAINKPSTSEEEILKEVSQRKEVVLFCESGIRSKKIATLISSKFPDKKIYNLTGGMRNYRQTIDHA